MTTTEVAVIAAISMLATEVVNNNIQKMCIIDKINTIIKNTKKTEIKLIREPEVIQKLV